MPQDPESHWAVRGLIGWLRFWGQGQRWSRAISIVGVVSLVLNIALLTLLLGSRQITRTPTVETSCPVGSPNVPGGTDPWGGCWPNASNAGIPSGTSLTTYSGGCTISTTQTINAKDVKAACTDGIGITGTAVVTVTNSSLPATDVADTASLTVSDSKFDAGDELNFPGLGLYNFTATRIEVVGGQHSVQCAANCVVIDSYLHDQRNPMPFEPHNNAFISNGGHDMVLTHNTLRCEPIVNANDGGCSSDLSLFGDFEVIDDVLAEKNLMVANGSNIPYCTYGGSHPSKAFPDAINVRYIDNIFQKGSTGTCGVFGPVSIFDVTGTGNVWTNNKYDDGSTVSPSM